MYSQTIGSRYFAFWHRQQNIGTHHSTAFESLVERIWINKSCLPAMHLHIHFLSLIATLEYVIRSVFSISFSKPSLLPPDSQLQPCTFNLPQSHQEWSSFHIHQRSLALEWKAVTGCSLSTFQCRESQESRMWGNRIDQMHLIGENWWRQLQQSISA